MTPLFQAISACGLASARYARLRSTTRPSIPNLQKRIYTNELGQYAEGIEYYQHIVDNWPEYEFAWHAQYFVGMYYERLLRAGGITKSEADPLIEQAYQAVIEKYPDCSLAGHACLKLARPNFEKGRWAEAAMYFEVFLQLWQRNPEGQRPNRVLSVMYNLGRAYEKMSAFKLAAQVYGELIKIADPTDPRIERVKARLQELEGAKK